jgi:peroxiredoxin Q/BCP
MLDWLFEEPLPIGSPAPDFTLPDQDGLAVSLSSRRGQPVVLIFYPGDDTPVCRRQLCEFRDRWSEAERRGIAVFGLNPRGARSHAGFRTRNSLPFPLLVDSGGRVAKSYRAGGWIVRRTVYAIGPDGRIRYARRGKPPAEEVLAAAAQPADSTP